MDVDDKRNAVRFLRSEAVSIQLLLPCPDRSCPAEVVDCETVDVSRNGLRILLTEEVAAERILDICVELTDSPKRFLLTGETRWCRYNATRGSYEVGLEIQDGEGTDFAAWSDFFAAAEHTDGSG